MIVIIAKNRAPDISGPIQQDVFFQLLEPFRGGMLFPLHCCMVVGLEVLLYQVIQGSLGLDSGSVIRSFRDRLENIQLKDKKEKKIREEN